MYRRSYLERNSSDTRLRLLPASTDLAGIAFPTEFTVRAPQQKPDSPIK
jgi:hypothetical protein